MGITTVKRVLPIAYTANMLELTLLLLAFLSRRVEPETHWVPLRGMGSTALQPRASFLRLSFVSLALSLPVFQDSLKAVGYGVPSLVLFAASLRMALSYDNTNDHAGENIVLPSSSLELRP